MKYQLVLQWPSTSLSDYDRLIALEETLDQGIGEIGIVDGHDMGSGEMNIFIHTNSPQSALEKAGSLIKGQDGLNQLKAGYRDFELDEYIPIYPVGLKQFWLYSSLMLIINREKVHQLKRRKEKRFIAGHPRSPQLYTRACLVNALH